jgi:release factor glutamine methyltransferase
MLLLCPPGVYRAESDTNLLTAVMRRYGYAAGRDVLDVGTGTGALAIAAAREGASSVTAVDLSMRAVAAARLNSRMHRTAVAVHRGDLFAPVARHRFGLVVANPPYVPAETALLPRHRKSRSWDGGTDGRAVLDRICAGVERVLAPGGDVLLVHSAVSDPDRTVTALEGAGLAAHVLARARIPFGPVMRARAAMLEARGLIRPGERIEELVVVRARRV